MVPAVTLLVDCHDGHVACRVTNPPDTAINYRTFQKVGSAKVRNAAGRWPVTRALKLELGLMGSRSGCNSPGLLYI